MRQARGCYALTVAVHHGVWTWAVEGARGASAGSAQSRAEAWLAAWTCYRAARLVEKVRATIDARQRS